MALVGLCPFRGAGAAVDTFMLPVIKRAALLLASCEIVCMRARFALGRLAPLGDRPFRYRYFSVVGPCSVTRDVAGVGGKRGAASACMIEVVDLDHGLLAHVGCGSYRCLASPMACFASASRPTGRGHWPAACPLPCAPPTADLSFQQLPVRSRKLSLTAHTESIAPVRR